MPVVLAKKPGSGGWTVDRTVRNGTLTLTEIGDDKLEGCGRGAPSSLFLNRLQRVLGFPALSLTVLNEIVEGDLGRDPYLGLVR
jgi:hypothetical protein